MAHPKFKKNFLQNIINAPSKDIIKDSAEKANPAKVVKTPDGKPYRGVKAYWQAVEAKANNNKPKQRTYPKINSPGEIKPGVVNAYNNLPQEQKKLNSFNFNGSNVETPFYNYQYEQVRQKKEQHEDSLGSFHWSSKSAIDSGNPLAIERAAKNEAVFKVAGEAYSPAYIEAMAKVKEALDGDYSYGVDAKDLKDWFEANYIRTKDEEGKDEYVLKNNAAPPPTAYDINGNKVDIKNEWQYFMTVTKYEELNRMSAEKAEKERQSMYANHADESMDTFNSMSDAIGTTIAERSIKAGVKGYLQYFSQYLLRPTLSGNFSAVGLNLLKDLGETMDMIPKGVKAFMGGYRGIYGHDSFFTNEEGGSFTHQTRAWHYSGGMRLQKKLMKLGAYDILEPDNYNIVARDDAVKKIKKAGLWEEFQKLQYEYKNVYKKHSGFDFEHALNNVKEVYTSHNNYEADTGNVVADLTLELLTDPTVWIGGSAKSITKTATKNIGSEALSTALSLVNKNIDTLDKSTSKFLNTQVKSLSENMLSKSNKELQRTAYNIGTVLQHKGIMTELEADTFRNQLVKNIRQRTDEKAFTVVKSLHYTDKLMDKVDSTLLKSVFAVPYLGVKIPKGIIGNVPKGTFKFNVFKRLGESRVAKGLIDPETNQIPIYNFRETLERLKQEPRVSEDADFVSEEYVKIKKSVEFDTNRIDRIIFDCADNLETLEKNLSEYIQKVTDGKYVDFKGYIYELEQLNEDYGGALGDTLDVAKRQFEKYDEYKSSLKDSHLFECANRLKSKEGIQDTVHQYSAEIDDPVLLEKLYLIEKQYQQVLEKEVEVDSFTAMYQDRVISIRKDYHERFQKHLLETTTEDPSLNTHAYAVQLLKDYEKQAEEEIKAFREKNEDMWSFDELTLAQEELEDSIKDFDIFVQSNYESPKSYKEAVISGATSNKHLSDKDIVVNASKSLVNTLEQKRIALALEYNEYISAEAPYKWFFKHNLKTAPTIEGAKVACESLLKEFSYNLAVGGNVDIQRNIYDDVRRFYNELLETEYMVDVKKHLQYNKFHKDKYIMYEVFMRVFEKQLDIFNDSNSKIFKVIDTYMKSDTSTIAASIPPIAEIAEQLKSVDTFSTFWRRLHLDKGPLTDDHVYRVIDSVFNRDWVNPHNLTDVTGKEMDTLINKINTSLSALDGSESLALDSFRKSALDFDGDLWRQFSKEIQNPTMQDRVRAVLAGGHENPLDDVNVQILQVILRNPDSVKYYNKQSKIQDVIFYDIETRGLSIDAYDITSVATKKWTLTSDEPTLDEIVSMLEEGEGKVYQTYLPEATLRETISDDILNINYKNRPDIVKSRTAMMDEYCRTHSSEAYGKVVTEKDILSEFTRDMDSSFIARKNKAPKLIAHNNNGFDLQFMKRRMLKKEHEAFPSHLKDLNEMFSKEENTYIMLRNIQPDAVLSYTQEQFIRNSVADYARSMSSFSASMRVFKPGEFLQSLKNFTDMDLSKYDKIWKEAQGEVSTIYNRLIDSQSNLAELLAQDTAIFARDPFHVTVESLSSKEIEEYFGKNATEAIIEAKSNFDEEMLVKYNEELTTLYLEKEYGRKVKGSDSTMRMIKDTHSNDKIPRIGYRTVKVDSISNYFDIVNQRIPQHTLMSINNFAKSCNIAITKRLKSNALLLGHLEEFQSVINYVKQFAKDLDMYDDMYYLKFIKTPESIEEAYVVAQKLWDTFKATTNYNKVTKYIQDGTLYADIPDKYKVTALLMQHFGDDFDIERVVSDEVCNILNNTRGMYHYQIFKDASRPKEVMYLEDISEDELLQDAYINECRQDEFSLETMSALCESNKTSKTKDQMLISNLRNSRETIEYRLKLSKKEANTFDKECEQGLSKMMDVQTVQIMDYISSSEDALISHLLYHNQLLVIPIVGTELHNKQVSALMKVLQKDSAYVCSTIDNNNYLWIGLKKEWQNKIQVKNDAAHVVEDTEMYFFGESKVYKKPKYDRLKMEQGVISDETLAKYFSDTEEQVLRLSKGASAGSLGILHTMSKQRKLYENAPQDFLNQALDLEYTCNERLWHNANYDMTLLGGMNNRWKVGNQNDTDYLLATRQTLRESAKKAQAERLYINGIWGAYEYMGIKDVFPEDMSLKDIAEAFKKNDDMVCLALRESKTTESGFQVVALDVTTKRGVSAAMQENTAVVPYSMYATLAETINQSKASTGFLKMYTRIMHTYKVGYLFSPATWGRNFIDATLKGIGDTSDPLGLGANYIKGAQYLRKYKAAVRQISQMRGVGHNVLIDLERMWDSFGFDLSFDEFKFLDEWLQRSESGGESSVLKAVKKNRENGRLAKEQIRKNNDGRDLIGDSIIQFEAMDELDARKLFNKAELGEVTRMTEDEFADIFSKRIVADEATRMEYESVVQVLMKQKVPWKYDLGSFYQTITDKMLAPTSIVEEMVRLGEYLTLEEQGYTQSQIFKKITDSQFNSALKSDATKRLEMIIPFYSFMHDNLIYWCKAISENPRMLHYVEKIWGELSWNFSDYEPEELIESYSLQSTMLNGNVPLGDTRLIFKVKPSFLDAFKISYSPLEQLYSSTFTPFQPFIQDSLKGSDARLLFGDKTFWEDEQDVFEIFGELSLDDSRSVLDAVETLPVVGTLVNRYFSVGGEYMKRLSDDAYSHKLLVRVLPDLFGVPSKKEYEEYGSFQFFQSVLATYNKFYDSNLQKIVDIKYKNKEGLNDTTLDWKERQDEMLKRHGEVFDANQGEYVYLNHMIPFDLNKEWDFSKEGEWDEFCKLKKKYLGEEWDYNLEKFVPSEELTKGGLNRDDLTWVEVKYYNARLGKFYNDELNKFVTLDDFSFEEQKAIRATLFGEAWDEGSKAWVQVANPMDGFGDVIDTASSTPAAETDFIKYAFLAEVYAAEPEKLRRVASDFKEATPEEIQMFLDAMSKIGLGDYTSYNGAHNYRSFKTPSYRSFSNKRTGTSYVQTPKPTQYSRSSGQGIKAGGKTYSTPYQSSGNQSGLRNAASNYPAYDEYYNYEYTYQYKYHNPTKSVADFPQTKLGIQRYMRLRTDALTRKLRLRAEYNIDNMSNVSEVGSKSRIEGLKFHWWAR